MYKFKPLIWIDQTEQAVEGYKGLETAFLELERRNPASEDVEHSVAAFYTSFTEVENWHVYFTGSDPAEMIRVAVFNAVQSELMADLSSAEQHDEAIAIGEAMLETVTADYRREPSDAGYWRQYFQKMQMLGEAYAQAERFETACDYLRQAADSAALFDQEIGISESDRQHVLTSLMSQKAACEEGRTADILPD